MKIRFWGQLKNAFITTNCTGVKFVLSISCFDFMTVILNWEIMNSGFQFRHHNKFLITRETIGSLLLSLSMFNVNFFTKHHKRPLVLQKNYRADILA